MPRPRAAPGGADDEGHGDQKQEAPVGAEIAQPIDGSTMDIVRVLPGGFGQVVE